MVTVISTFPHPRRHERPLCWQTMVDGEISVDPSFSLAEDRHTSSIACMDSAMETELKPEAAPAGGRG